MTMVHFASVLNGLARNISIKKGRNCKSNAGREAAEALAKEAKRNSSMLCSSGTVKAAGSKNVASSFSRRGEKGVNQDCIILWEEFGCQEDIMFCGVFDGHGPWGHLIAKRVMEVMASSLLCTWQETLALASPNLDFEIKADKCLHQRDIWEQSYLKTCAAIDQELQQHSEINSFCSGTTALTVIKQGEMIVVANVGDSRAVLATSEDGNLVPIQLTIDFKPDLPQEAERIKKSKGRVLCLNDEPGVYRVWNPNGETPGLALSRAFGDHCMKDYGVISAPEVTQRNITKADQFVILATDGVWEVISNEEAVQIVASVPEREKSAKRLVDSAIRAWKHKRRAVAMDDISAICLFFHASSPD